MRWSGPAPRAATYAVGMTTLDVSVSGPNGSIDLSNGLLGPASAVFFGATEALEAGRATGTAGAAGCNVTMKGSVLLELLRPDPGWLHQSQSSDADTIRTFYETIDPDADYRVGALEF